MDVQIYKAIVNAIPDMIIRISQSGVFRSFEGATAELYWPAEAYLGKHLNDVLPKETADLFARKIEAAFRTNEVQYLEYSLRFDGRRRYYESRMIRSNEDEALAIVRNVTQEKAVAAELRRHHEDLESLVKERTAELSRAETSYRSIFHHSGSPSIIVDHDFTIAMANSKFEELTGYAREEIEGQMKWIDFIAASDRETVTRYHYTRRRTDGQVPSEYECQITDRRGRTLDIFIKVGMLPEPGRAIASLIDITSLKRTEKDLREREALYSAILEGYEGMLYFISNDYRIRFMNENLVRAVGRDAVGELCYEALHNRRSKCPWCVSDQVFEGEAVRFEMRNPNDKKWYFSVNVPIPMADGITYCQAMIRDIDQRKRMEEALRDSEAHLRKENLRLRSTIKQRNKFGDIVGSSEAMQQVYELMLMAASSDANIILYGESGTGKELVASAVHNMSDRREGNFVPVNCGAIPEALLEREFFGHRKGAFTGATEDKQGYLDEADGGTLFLDEIGEIKPDLQVKLLRAIEGGGYTPIGSNEVRKPDFRIIAATSRNLTEMVQKGGMRSDFFYRVHVIPVHLPPLRQRKEDIPLLVEHFLQAYDRKMHPVISGNIKQSLMAYEWPGNVRELQNVLYRFVTLKRLDLTGETVPETIAEPSVAAAPSTEIPDGDLSDAIAAYEKQLIRAALVRCRWNRTQTAKVLGIGLRTLQRKMKTLGIH
ncbi:MAG: sigma 54-interacting transcriptional regulator [Desulfobacterales bacterium]|nr:sigma 54-interacting transcriptional regulator [Desulfobacterales bacterium]MDJ0882567.1 sigma 54-interacting transcriptional regulator [Desulfobacterales bacterium]